MRNTEEIWTKVTVPVLRAHIIGFIVHTEFKKNVKYQ